MPDFVIRNIDSLLAERILALAEARQQAVNDVILTALRRGMGMSLPGANVARATLGAIEATQGHHWDPLETAVFQEAIRALATSEPATLAPLQDG